jgi:hypothetical protein
MTFEESLDQAIAMLQRRRCLTYGTLKRQFQLDDAALDDLKNELIKGQRLAVDEDGVVLVWTGDASNVAPTAAPPARPADRAHWPTRPHTHRFEGTVNQVLGDGIMVLFGAPIAHEDHALCACYASLAMQTAMRAYTEEVRRIRGLELRMRVGLNSGEVVVRAIGNDLHMDYSAVGETTHLAARMEQLATPGSIRLSAATLGLVEDLVQVTALEPVPMKGLEEPVEVFDLVGASHLRRRLQAAAARGLTPFVGRRRSHCTSLALSRPTLTLLIPPRPKPITSRP